MASTDDATPQEEAVNYLISESGDAEQLNDMSTSSPENAAVSPAIDKSESGPAETSGGDDEKHNELEQLRDELQRVKRELDDAKSEVAVSGFLQETLAESERKNKSLKEELATMHTLLVEAADGQEQENQAARLRQRYRLLEAENRDLKVQLKLIETKRAGQQSGGGSGGSSGGTRGQSGPVSPAIPDRETLLGGAAVLSDKTKNMVRKMKSTMVQSVIPGGQSPEDELRKAQEDASVLRAIVLPLEEQIAALKGKLRESDALLQEYEKRQAGALVEMESVAAWILQEGDKDALEKKIKEAVGDGYSGDEGQLYHAMLAGRIGLLSQQLDLVSKERDESVNQLESVKKEMGSIKTRLEGELRAEKAAVHQQVNRLMPKLTDEDKRELHTAFPHLLSALSSSPSENSTTDDPSTYKRIVSEKEWELLQSFLEANQQGGEATSSEVNQAQRSPQPNRQASEAALLEANKNLERLKNELREITKERDHLADNCEKYKEDLANEAAFRKEMESTWNSRGAEYRAQVTDLAGQLKVTRHTLDKISGEYKKLVETTKSDLSLLTTNREKLVRELKRLQDENDNLVGKHSELAATMANEMINLPSSPDEMQLLLLRYREDLITAKIAKERAEEKLASDLTFMKSRLASEQQNMAVREESFTNEIQNLRKKCDTLERAGQILEQEREKRRGLEHRIVQLEQDLVSRGAEANKQNETATQNRKNAENLIAELRNKISSLQTDLDNSVAVQTDFVRLSQSLQVELEKIRQAEKEVRWQHEDDIDDCNSCRTRFSSSKKRKANCKHCGRIFCGDCLGKEVTSGPNSRQVRVCDVCHTLLVQHSAPYFSLEAPHTD